MMPATPAAIDRQAALADARLVLGVIDVLEHLDNRDEPLAAQITRLESWLDTPAGGAAQEQILSRLLH